MTNKSNEITTMTVNISDIEVDDKFNARKIVDESADKELARQIKKDGLLQPVAVQEAGDGKYMLRFGFRRLRVCKSILEWETIPVVVWEGTPEDAVFINLAENVARADLTPPEVAFRCLEIHQEYDLSGAKIAARLGKSRGYVGNLMRCAENLHPDIVARWWEENTPDWKKGRVCTTDWLNATQALDQDEQIKMFHAVLGINPEEGTAGEEGTGDGGDPEPTPNPQRRPSKKHLIAAIAAVKDATGLHAQYKKGAVQALRWALGEVDTLGDVYDPKNPPAVEE